MIAIRQLPDRKCEGCSRQAEWGCTAFKFRDTEPHEDPREGWLNPAHMPLQIDGEEVYACPRRHIKQDPRYWAQLLKYYGFYKKGFLPEGGGIISQANQLMEAFRVLDVTNAECDEAERTKSERKRGDPLANRGK